MNQKFYGSAVAVCVSFVMQSYQILSNATVQYNTIPILRWWWTLEGWVIQLLSIELTSESAPTRHNCRLHSNHHPTTFPQSSFWLYSMRIIRTQVLFDSCVKVEVTRITCDNFDSKLKYTWIEVPNAAQEQLWLDACLESDPFWWSLIYQLDLKYWYWINRYSE